MQEELEREVKSLRKQMASMEQETERQRSSLEEQIATLQETLSEVSWVPSAKESFLSTCSLSSSHLLPTSSPPPPHLLPTCRKRHCLPKGRRNYISWRPQPGVWSQGREDCYAVVLSSLMSPMLNTNPHHQHILGLASLLRAWS